MSPEYKNLEEAMERALAHELNGEPDPVGSVVSMPEKPEHRSAITKVSLDLMSDTMTKTRERAEQAIAEIDSAVAATTEDFDEFIRAMNTLKGEQEQVVEMTKAALGINGKHDVRPVRKRNGNKRKEEPTQTLQS